MSTENRASMVSRVFQDPMIGTFADLTIEENMSLAARHSIKCALALSLNSKF